MYLVKNDGITFDNVKKYFSTKNNCWNYECERKVLLLNKNRCQIPSAPISSSINGIIFGLAHSAPKNCKDFTKQSNFRKSIISEIEKKYAECNPAVYYIDTIDENEIKLRQ